MPMSSPAAPGLTPCASYLAAAVPVVVVRRGGEGLQPQLLIELADEVVCLNVHALVVAPILWHDKE